MKLNVFLCINVAIKLNVADATFGGLRRPHPPTLAGVRLGEGVQKASGAALCIPERLTWMSDWAGHRDVLITEGSAAKISISITQPLLISLFCS